MKTQEAAKLFEVLSSDVRLDIFRLLVKHAPEGLVAGEIAKQLDLPSTNLSFHLKTIAHTGLISLEKEGRFSRYRANIPLMLDVIAYLTAECCASHPEHCLNLQTTCAVPLDVS
ncbi:MAG: helix-turn-helix domain-containing protein [Candidatus Accumulibacter sp.]|jgi:DNA-binding transcriptional ArsR family regulator|nr:helix-turn-helix domain-containing protein [Accumulibacter sp.]